MRVDEHQVGLTIDGLIVIELGEPVGMPDLQPVIPREQAGDFVIA
jgi:hypothetical protein